MIEAIAYVIGGILAIIVFYKFLSLGKDDNAPTQTN